MHFDDPDGVPLETCGSIFNFLFFTQKISPWIQFFIVVSFLSLNEVGIKSVLINYCILQYVCNGSMLIGMPYTAFWLCASNLSVICPISSNLGNLITILMLHNRVLLMLDVVI
jgi:hypothetical protein